MLGRYEPIETMRSWPSNGLRVGAVREQSPVVRAASNMGMEPPPSRARLMPGVGQTSQRGRPQCPCSGFS